MCVCVHARSLLVVRVKLLDKVSASAPAPGADAETVERYKGAYKASNALIISVNC